MDPKRYLPICAFLAIAAVSGLWILFYISYSTNGLPLGWDTPYYIWRIHSAAASGISAFVASARYYDFLYPAIGSLISPAGIHPVCTELVIAPFLLVIGNLVIL